MFDDAALALEEITPEDKNRTEVLGARVVLYIAAKKWDMAAVVASHLVKVEPENEAWWINLAYSVRRSEGVEKAEAILLRARAIHPNVAMIAFTSPATPASRDAWKRRKSTCGVPSILIRTFGNSRSTMKI
jgi:lipopolysaccharide biosynthesis regulator YciM